MNKDLTKIHEWELSAIHKTALKNEDFETCELVQAEVDKRITNNTINHNLMNGFKYWNPETKKYEGSLTYSGLNGLFNEYQK